MLPMDLPRTSSISQQDICLVSYQKNQVAPVTAVEISIQTLEITLDDFKECDPLKRRLEAHQRFEGKPKLATENKWTDKRHEPHRARILG